MSRQTSAAFRRLQEANAASEAARAAATNPAPPSPTPQNGVTPECGEPARGLVTSDQAEIIRQRPHLFSLARWAELLGVDAETIAGIMRGAPGGEVDV